jgi:hypothetical protein
MLLFALMLVAVQVSIHGLSPEPDEGTLARLYQLLVVGQTPTIAFFGIRWLRQAPLQGLRVVVAQGFALAAKQELLGTLVGQLPTLEASGYQAPCRRSRPCRISGGKPIR